MKLKRTLCVVFGTLIAFFISPVIWVIGEVISEVTVAEVAGEVGLYLLVPYLLIYHSRN